MSIAHIASNTAIRHLAIYEALCLFERLDEVIKDHNSEKSDIYKTAKGDGYDPKIIRKCISIRKNGAAKHERSLK